MKMMKKSNHTDIREHPDWKDMSRPLDNESQIRLACDLLGKKYTFLKIKEGFKEELSLKEEEEEE